VIDSLGSVRSTAHHSQQTFPQAYIQIELQQKKINIETMKTGREPFACCPIPISAVSAEITSPPNSARTSNSAKSMVHFE
jgi:hypothetical protein